ncbi:MAG: GGDEF domain-containing protein, partial [Gammaproteobacteria bacterium]|nr:GGDEF domain-containing protein [Gammaproteobacteria bacterium]
VLIGTGAFMLMVLALGLGWQDWRHFRQAQLELASTSLNYGVDLLNREYWRIQHQAQLFAHVYPDFVEELLRVADQPQQMNELAKLLQAWFPGYHAMSFFPLTDCDIHLPSFWQRDCQAWAGQQPRLLLDRPGAPLGLSIPFKDAGGEAWVVLINRDFTPLARVMQVLSLNGIEGLLVPSEKVSTIPDRLAYADLDANPLEWSLVMRARPEYWRVQWQYIALRVGGLITLIFFAAFGLAYLETRMHAEMQQRLDLEAIRAKLYEQATRDALTGLFNRYAFNEHFQLLVRQSQRLRQPMAVLLIDIDYFKQVNDQWGHEAGDELLRKVAEVIGECARRPLDMAARLGGEEFAVLLEGASSTDAWALGELLRLQVADLRLPHPTRSFVSVSVGVSSSGPDYFIPLKDLLERADRALYAAKRRGRNLVVGDWEVEA